MRSLGTEPRAKQVADVSSGRTRLPPPRSPDSGLGPDHMLCLTPKMETFVCTTVCPETALRCLEALGHVFDGVSSLDASFYSPVTQGLLLSVANAGSGRGLQPPSGKGQRVNVSGFRGHTSFFVFMSS